MSRSPAMVVAGVMSGTSADGIDIALVRIQETQARSRSHGLPRLAIKLLGHTEYPYPAHVRSKILSAMNAANARVSDLARLNILLGELYAEAILAARRRFRRKIDLIGCHGQTLYHQGEAGDFLGRKIRATWQVGEAAIIAARTGVPVVSDFRPADLAAGGKGAPLVPYLDYLLFHDPKLGRIVQNIGGIANLSAIPAGAEPGDVVAFDTGPGNMVIDSIMEALYGRRFDRGGTVAASGSIIEPVLRRVLARRFFHQKPPKTAGREEFGREFISEFLRLCTTNRKQDVVATATALTARSIADALRRFVVKKSAPNSFHEMLISGGGTRNRTLVCMLADALAPMHIRLKSTDALGLPSQAKEAVAFAVLAYETWHRRPSNIPSATGAHHPAILGKICYA
jgi:anhydro-N-acetylmuramic acid kinase